MTGIFLAVLVYEFVIDPNENPLMLTYISLFFVTAGVWITPNWLPENKKKQQWALLLVSACLSFSFSVASVRIAFVFFDPEWLARFREIESPDISLMPYRIMDFFYHFLPPVITLYLLLRCYTHIVLMYKNEIKWVICGFAIPIIILYCWDIPYDIQSVYHIAIPSYAIYTLSIGTSCLLFLLGWGVFIKANKNFADGASIIVLLLIIALSIICFGYKAFTFFPVLSSLVLLCMILGIRLFNLLFNSISIIGAVYMLLYMAQEMHMWLLYGSHNKFLSSLKSPSLAKVYFVYIWLFYIVSPLIYFFFVVRSYKRADK